MNTAIPTPPATPQKRGYTEQDEIHWIEATYCFGAPKVVIERLQFLVKTFKKRENWDGINPDAVFSFLNMKISILKARAA